MVHQDFSKISKPLYNLLEKDVNFKFDKSCLQVFHTLKKQLVIAPIIVASDWDLSFKHMSYASDCHWCGFGVNAWREFFMPFSMLARL